MISIFAKLPFLNVDPSHDFKFGTVPKRGHLLRVSSLIRAMQISEYLGCKLNPTEGYENDTCIYIKPNVKKGGDFKFEGRNKYLDIIDGHNLGGVVSKHPEVGVITCSQVDFETMKSCIPNKVVLIPQHHLNFEHFIRPSRDIKTVGVIGTQQAFPWLPEEFEQGLKDRGMELLTFSKFFSREDCRDFYRKIDVQIVWRPYHKTMSNPLKIVNASSFGIPTIALDEPAFQEVAGCYIPVTDLNEFFKALDDLRESKTMYSEISERCLKKSEEYDISNISKLYLELDQ